MKTTFWILVAILANSTLALALEEGMTQMPKIKPKTSYTVQTNEKGEDLLDSRGFGEKEPMVRMMNLMMVEGSGYEGMDMNDASMKSNAGHEMNHGHQMKMAANESPQAETPSAASSDFKFEATIAPSPAKVGANTVTITIRDSKSGESKKGLKPKAQVYMTSMDMGTDEPRVRESSPGKYQLKATFSMKGPWAVKLILPNEEKVFNFEATK